jgi:uncharacterized protein (TIGR00251 family)
MSEPGFLQSRPDGVYVSLKVQPRASKNEIGEVIGNELKVKVTAPPVDSAANEAVLRLLAEALDCPRNAVQLVRGAAARHKQVRVVGVAVEEVAKRLGSLNR